jgi:hypothetical protein
MKTTLKKLCEAAMAAQAETWADVRHHALTTDPDLEFDNDTGRLEGGFGHVVTNKAHYVFGDDNGKRVVTSYPLEPVAEGGAPHGDEKPHRARGRHKPE